MQHSVPKILRKQLLEWIPLHTDVLTATENEFAPDVLIYASILTRMAI